MTVYARTQFIGARNPFGLRGSRSWTGEKGLHTTSPNQDLSDGDNITINAVPAAPQKTLTMYKV
jgi:hypothetical protein